MFKQYNNNVFTFMEYACISYASLYSQSFTLLSGDIVISEVSFC